MVPLGQRNESCRPASMPHTWNTCDLQIEKVREGKKNVSAHVVFRQFCQACERGESGYKLASDHAAVKRAINASVPSSLISRS